MDKPIFLDVIFSAYFNKGTILPNNSEAFRFIFGLLAKFPFTYQPMIPNILK